MTLELDGAEFPADATVRLIRPTISEHAPVSIQRVDATKIIAVFDLRTAATGLYDVVVLHPDGRQAIEPYRFQIESVDPMRVDVGVGGPSLIPIGGTGVYGVTVRNLANIDTPYTEVTVAVPRIQNPMPSLIPGEALKVFSGINGLPSRSNLDLSQYDALMNLGGVYTTGGMLLDLPTHKFESSSIFVQTYPELVRLLEEDPLFLKRLDPAQIDLLSFEFYVAAAATPLTATEYLDRKRQEAAKIRAAILADSNAPTALVQLANDASSWTNAYIQGLGAVGLIRPEDMPPVADGRAQVVAGFFAAVAGLLGTDAGAAVLRNIERDPINASAAKSDLVERIRGYLGHEPEAYSAGLPDRSQYDLGTTSETSFAAFRLFVGNPSESNAASGSEIDVRLNGSTSSDLVRVFGPNGQGPNNLVPMGQPLPFTIQSTVPQNRSQAVRSMRITVPIDNALDTRTFQLSDIQLGKLQIALPSGRTSFTGEFDFTADYGFAVQVTAGVDVTSRTAVWTFAAIDARDGLPPADPNVGLIGPGESARVGYWMELINEESVNPRNWSEGFYHRNSASGFGGCNRFASKHPHNRCARPNYNYASDLPDGQSIPIEMERLR